MFLWFFEAWNSFILLLRFGSFGGDRLWSKEEHRLKKKKGTKFFVAWCAGEGRFFYGWTEKFFVIHNGHYSLASKKPKSHIQPS